jgi:multiple sugar transport system permease protein
MIDGATRLQALRLITLPLAVPGVVTAGIFAFTLSWNEFIYSLVLVTSDANRTLPVGVITQLVSGDLYAWGPLMAAALLGSIPVVLLFSFFVEQYVSGLTAGAMKG